MARILVVDDDARQLDLRARIFETAGYQVAVAFSPAEAGRHIAGADIVVMDLRFPNAQGEADAAEGRKLIRQIRDSGSRAPILVLSGWPADLLGTPEEGLVSRVLLKPLGMAALLAAVAEFLTEAAAPARNPA
jgi:CheY-like chemotaxis protein